jgi:hypothetical protein
MAGFTVASGDEQCGKKRFRTVPIEIQSTFILYQLILTPVRKLF